MRVSRRTGRGVAVGGSTIIVCFVGGVRLRRTRERAVGSEGAGIRYIVSIFVAFIGASNHTK